MSAHENFYSKNLIWFYSSRKEIHLIASTSVFNFKILYTNPPPTPPLIVVQSQKAMKMENKLLVRWVQLFSLISLSTLLNGQLELILSNRCMGMTSLSTWSVSCLHKQYFNSPIIYTICYVQSIFILSISDSAE